jgi:hypothetical protein
MQVLGLPTLVRFLATIPQELQYSTGTALALGHRTFSPKEYPSVRGTIAPFVSEDGHAGFVDRPSRHFSGCGSKAAHFYVSSMKCPFCLPRAAAPSSTFLPSQDKSAWPERQFTLQANMP